ncbi:cytochrome P450 2U1-like [Glandiceps talaboti]
MLTLILVFIVSFIACVYIVHGCSNSNRNLPPGPVGLPFFGCLHKLVPIPCETFMTWAKKYGDVFSVRLGVKRVVVINGYETIREALTKNRYTFSGRPLMWIWVPVFDNKGMNSNVWSTWKAQRALTLNGLREFGMGTRTMEERISRECGELIRAVERKRGTPFDPTDFLHHATSNVLVSVIFGQRLDYDDPEFSSLLKRSLALTQMGIIAVIANFFPVLFKLPLSFLGLSSLKESVRLLAEYMGEKIEERKKLNNNVPECFIDSYIKRLNSSSSSHDNIDLSQLPYVLIELMLGGSDTTATTLKWCLVNMLRNPHTQKKIQYEVDLCCDKDGKITYASKTNMPYTEAFILETQRVATLFPIGVSRRAMEDVVLKGYNIPKDIEVIINLWSAHMDERIWIKPEKFDPYRFLNDKGDEVINKEHLVTFALGARSCIGAQIARVELFLMLTSLLKEFEFTTPEGELPPSNKGIHAVTYTPLPFKVVAKKRHT